MNVAFQIKIVDRTRTIEENQTKDAYKTYYN
jgi:hypothetical protein